MSQEVVRVAAVGDLHCTKTSQSAFQPLFSHINESADVLLLCGDLTDYGLEEEAQILAREIAAALKIPIVAVLGNHDYESGRPHEVQHILADAGVRVLNGESCEIRGISFVGVKGFVGGFGQRALEPVSNSSSSLWKTRLRLGLTMGAKASRHSGAIQEGGYEEGIGDAHRRWGRRWLHVHV